MVKRWFKRWRKILIAGLCFILFCVFGALYMLGIFPPLTNNYPVTPLLLTNKQQVKILAEKYLKQLHWPILSSPSIENYNDYLWYYTARQKSRSINTFSLNFDAHTGQLTEARLSKFPYKTTTIGKLTPHKAIQMAQHYAKIASYSLEGLQLEINKFWNYYYGEITPISYWVVSYRCFYRGYQYRDPAAQFYMDPDTGELRKMFLNMRPLPPSTSVRMNKWMAVQLAKTALILKGYTHLEIIPSAKLCILPDIVDYKDINSSYLGWEVSFHSEESSAGVLINATTCRVEHSSYLDF